MDDSTRAGLTQTCDMMCALAEIGAGGIAIEMADFSRACHGLPPLSADLRRYLTGPIVCHSGFNGWGPDWEGHPVRRDIFKNQIMAERCAISLGISPYLVGPTELMAVLYAFSADAPMSREGGAFYLWAAAHAMAKQSAHKTLEAVQDHVFGSGLKGGHDRLSDADVLTPGTPMHNLYLETCAAIRSKVSSSNKRSGRASAVAADFSKAWAGMDLPDRLDVLQRHKRPVHEALHETPAFQPA